MKLKNKKGELTTQQIIILIILILSFAVILYFIFSLNLGQESDKEICRNSVVLRANSVLGADSVPLNCQRQYVCISEDGSCEKMTDPEIIKVKEKDEVYQALADELADCWWMFGEGKLNYVGEDALPELYCSICSQIAFDDSLSSSIGGDLSKKEFYNYLEKTSYSEKASYLDYLGLRPFFDNYQEDFGTYDLSKQYYSLTGISSEVSSLGWVLRVGATVGTVAGGLALTPLTGGASGFTAAALVLGAKVSIAGGVIGGVAGGVLVAPIIEGLSGEDFIPPTLIEAGSPEFKALNCEKINTKS